MMKRNIKLLICMILLVSVVKNSVFATIDEQKLHSTNIGVYNLENMDLLYAKNNNEQISIASITKVMTAIVAIENISDLDSKIIIDYDTIYNKIDEDLVTAGIYDLEELSYYDLLCTMLISSGADSAMYLAVNLFENEDIFIQKMNEKAKELGMNNTSFSNPTGLDDENNYSTIDDVAVMMKYALNNEILKEIMSMKTYTTTDGNITVKSTISRSALLYGVDVENIIGGKTGTTGNAGLCLASFSQDEDVSILAIVTGASMYSAFPYNIIDTEYIYDEIITSYSKQIIINNMDILYTLPTVCTKQDSVNIYSKEDIYVYTDFVDKDKISVEYDGMDSLDYTVKQGEIVGRIKIYYDDVLVKEVDAYLDEKLNFSVIKWMKINKYGVITISSIVIIIVLLLIIMKKKKSNKKMK